MKKKRFNFHNRHLSCMKQIYRVMKLTTFFLFVLFFQVSASVFSQNNGKLSLKVEQKSINSILKLIEEQTNYTFMYNRNNIDVERKTDINCDVEDIEKVLDILFEGTNVKYRSFNNNYVLYTEGEMPVIQSRQIRTVSGKVTNTSGEPIPGVAIVVKGTSQGIITDSDGNYTLARVPGDATLLFSFVGMKTQEIPVAGKTTISIVMEEDAIGIEEVVAIGYGTMKKSDLTGSLTSLGSEKIVSSHKQSTTAALQGTIPGVDIIKNGNNPGSGFNIMIRGQNTISDASTTGNMNDINPPLYVVDGMMMSSISDIAPDDIERIDVLKDASSTAIYGSRGANGVVLVTTKKGSSGKGRFYTEYNGFVSFSSATNLPDMMNGQQWADYKVQRYKGTNWKNYLNGEANPTYADVLTTQQLSNLNAGKNVDWVDELLGVAVSQNHSARVYGNGEGLVYSFGLGYTDEAGVTGDTDDYKRYNLSASIDKELNEHLKAGINMYNTYSILSSTPETVRQAYRLSPLADMYKDDGSLRTFPDDALSNVSNPLVERKNNVRETKTLHAFGNVYLEYKPLKWLTLKTTFSPDLTFDRYGGYAASQSKTGKGSAENTRAYYETSNTQSYTWTNIATLKKNFGIHSFDVMLGTEWFKKKQDGLEAQVRNFATDAYTFYNLAAGASINTLDSYYSGEQWMSYFSRLNYSLKDKYLLTLTGRYDGSSRLAKGHKWKFFPSAALGWRLSEEDFMKNQHLVSNLKLRLSYGISGNNNNIDPYETSATIDNNYYLFGDNASVASTISSFANTTLSWETTKEWNLGADFGLYKGRVNGSIDLYTRRTEDILMDRVLSVMNGYSSVIDNVGVVDNKGIEFSLASTNISTKDFSWTTNLNFTTNHNEIAELSDGSTSDEANQWFVGESVGVVWDYKPIGYWGVDEIDEAAAYGCIPGSVKVLEVDGNTSSTNADKVFRGNRYPKWTGGITNTFTYQNFSLSVFVYTRQGQMSYSQFHWTTALDDNANFNHMNLKYWTPEDPEGAEWHRAGTSGYGQTSALMWQKTSFVKVGYITLGYDLPKTLISKWGLNKCHLYFSCQNPFVFTKYKGWDPEAPSKGTDTSYFMTKSFDLGVNLNF